VRSLSSTSSEEDRAAILWMLFLIPTFGLVRCFPYGNSMHRGRPWFKKKEAADRARLEAVLNERSIGPSEPPLIEFGPADYEGLVRWCRPTGRTLTSAIRSR
jgi:hypothetical protein